MSRPRTSVRSTPSTSMRASSSSRSTRPLGLRDSRHRSTAANGSPSSELRAHPRFACVVVPHWPRRPSVAGRLLMEPQASPGEHSTSVRRTRCAESPNRGRAVTKEPSNDVPPYDLPEQYRTARESDPRTPGQGRHSAPRRSKSTGVERHARVAESRVSSAAETARLTRRSALRVGALAGTAGLLGAGIWRVTRGDLFGAEHPNAAPGTTALSTATNETGTGTVPAVSDVYARWVQDENALPGTTEWNVGSLGDEHAIEGFFDTTSAAHGDTVKLFVSTTASTFRVEAYRMGWYQGSGGRLVWSSPERPGRVQPAPTVDNQTNMVDTAWQQPLPIDITDDYVPGCYLFKLVSSDGHGRYVPLTIRDGNNHSAFLVMNAVSTWQAYNQWGGYSLYWGTIGT